MKKLFNLFAILFVAGMLAGLVSCSNPSSSSSSSEILATYQGEKYGQDDTIYTYKDKTWKEVYADGVVYAKGTYEIKEGDEMNGKTELTVTYSKLPEIPENTIWEIEINDGGFRFKGCYYRILKTKN